MPLLVDIGNTHTRVAHCGGNGGIILDRVIPTSGVKEISLPEDGSIAICSVVPEVLKYFRERRGVFILEAAAYCGSMPVLADVSTLGSDRLANAAALFARKKFPAAAIDCGTAVTLEFVCREGFAGGAILPGRKLQRFALSAGTAQLREYPLAETKPVAAGLNTADAVAAGVDLGCAGAVERIIEEWEESAGCGCSCVFTGGDAEFFAGTVKRKSITEPLLTLQGLFEAWRESCV